MRLSEVKEKIKHAMAEDYGESRHDIDLQRRHSAEQRYGACKWVMGLLDQVSEWYDVTDTSIYFPSSHSSVLVCNANLDEHHPCRYSIIQVELLLKSLDSAYCHWTHWMPLTNPS